MYVKFTTKSLRQTCNNCFAIPSEFMYDLKILAHFHDFDKWQHLLFKQNIFFGISTLLEQYLQINYPSIIFGGQHTQKHFNCLLLRHFICQIFS